MTPHVRRSVSHNFLKRQGSYFVFLRYVKVFHAGMVTYLGGKSILNLIPYVAGDTIAWHLIYLPTGYPIILGFALLGLGKWDTIYILVQRIHICY